VKVGLVLVVGILLLVTFFAVINRWAVGEHWRVTTTFANVMGVDRDASVQYGGRRAGWVEDLQYTEQVDPKSGESVARVALVLAVDRNVPLTEKDLVYVDRSLTGEVVVEIDPHPGTRCTFGKPVVLPSKEVPTFAALMEGFDQTLTGLSSFAKAERPVVEEALANLRDTFAHAQVATTQLEELLGGEKSDLRQALQEFRQFAATGREVLTENRESLGHAIAAAGDLFTQLQSLLTDLEPKIKASADGLQDVTGRLQTFLTEHGSTITDTVANFRQLSQDLSELLASNRTRITETLADLRQTAASVRVTVEDLQRNPWKLVVRPLKEDTYTQNLYDTARALVLTSRELARAAEELQQLRQAVRSPEGEAEVEATLQAIRKQLERSTALQEQLWERLKAGR
jgi:ABC-type transporter Mla subunit MlaD